MSVGAYWMQAAALALFVALFALRRVVDRGRLLHRSSGDGAAPDIVVRERGAARELWFEDPERGGERGGAGAGERRMLHARVSTRNPLVSRLPYVDGFHMYMGGSNTSARVLFIGCGAGIGPRQFAHLYPGATIDVVDVDPRVFTIAERFFSFAPSPQLAVHVADGRQFLEQAAVTFDRIVIDAFGANDMPVLLFTQEFFELCKGKLSRKGACVVNVAGALEGPAASLARTLHAGMAAAFGEDHVRVYAVPRGRERRLDRRRRRNLLMFGFHATPPLDPAPAIALEDRSIVPALAALPAHRVDLPPGGEPLKDGAIEAPRLIIR